MIGQGAEQRGNKNVFSYYTLYIKETMSDPARPDDCLSVEDYG